MPRSSPEWLQALVVSRFSDLRAPSPAVARAPVARCVGRPCGASSLGAAVITAWLAAVPEVALVGCAPAAHLASSLTVATADGRAACGL